MKRKEIINLALIAIVSGVISLVIAGKLFGSQAKHGTAVPVVAPISSSLPDIKNDPNYNFFLNDSALDPTQPIQIGNSPNNTPFNNGQ